jgi:hypothetical protein
VPPDTATIKPRSPDRPRIRFQWWWPALVIAAVAIVVAVPRLIAGPATIGDVTLVNHTNYALDVNVGNGHGDGTTLLATVERGRTTVVGDVVDQGRTWVFQFESQGVDGGTLKLTKDALKRANWKVDIPASVGERLAAEGAPPTPPPGF